VTDKTSGGQAATVTGSSLDVGAELAPSTNDKRMPNDNVSRGNPRTRQQPLRYVLYSPTAAIVHSAPTNIGQIDAVTASAPSGARTHVRGDTTRTPRQVRTGRYWPAGSRQQGLWQAGSWSEPGPAAPCAQGAQLALLNGSLGEGAWNR
jgi:hypothetical protein